MPAYKYTGPINCDVDIDVSGLKGKTAIVTGGKSARAWHSSPHKLNAGLQERMGLERHTYERW
jgi:hypothetical protein